MKVYASCVYEIDLLENKQFKEGFIKLKELKQNLGEDSKLFNVIHKQFCNEVRNAIEETKVIGFGNHKTDENKIGIFIYDIEATNDNYYKQHQDDEGVYIEVSDDMEVSL